MSTSLERLWMRVRGYLEGYIATAEIQLDPRLLQEVGDLMPQFDGVLTALATAIHQRIAEQTHQKPQSVHPTSFEWFNTSEG